MSCRHRPSHEMYLTHCEPTYVKWPIINDELGLEFIAQYHQVHMVRFVFQQICDKSYLCHIPDETTLNEMCVSVSILRTSPIVKTRCTADGNVHAWVNTHIRFICIWSQACLGKSREYSNYTGFRWCKNSSAGRVTVPRAAETKHDISVLYEGKYPYPRKQTLGSELIPCSNVWIGSWF